MSFLPEEIIEQIIYFFSESLIFNNHYESIDSKQHPKRLIDNMRFVSKDFKRLFEYSFRNIYFEFYHINEVTVLSKLALKLIKRYENYFDPTQRMINYFKEKQCEELNFYESIILNTIIDCNDSIAIIFTDLFIKIGIFKIFSFGVDFTLSKECNCSGSDSKSWLIFKQSKDKRFWYYKCGRCQFYEKEEILYYYKILGLNERATDLEIKKTYKKLILIWHPDKNINNKEESEKKTKEITEAYKIITDYREKFKKTKVPKSKNTKPKKTNSKPRKPRQTKPKQTKTKQTKPKPKKEQQKSTKTEPETKDVKAEVDKEILNFLRTFLNTYNDIK
ncbi:8501_t:CDS:2 [Scutellospora calospora]|uniref:8501_t:CDS:1 n=1 Tax=Scutellospora calospora TaxID=85575 RepID=A0ACA9LI10_9GLOM|nr:8501_t:CDS:2 [Scutellospora calospora]